MWRGGYGRPCVRRVCEDSDRRGRTSSFARTSSVTCRWWYFMRSYASERPIPPASFGSQMTGGGASSSGAYSTPAISSAWSANGSEGKCGGASGCVRAARSVAVRSSSVSVAVS